MQIELRSPRGPFHFGRTIGTRHGCFRFCTRTSSRHRGDARAVCGDVERSPWDTLIILLCSGIKCLWDDIEEAQAHWTECSRHQEVSWPRPAASMRPCRRARARPGVPWRLADRSGRPVPDVLLTTAASPGDRLWPVLLSRAARTRTTSGRTIPCSLSRSGVRSSVALGRGREAASLSSRHQKGAGAAVQLAPATTVNRWAQPYPRVPIVVARSIPPGLRIGAVK